MYFGAVDDEEGWSNPELFCRLKEEEEEEGGSASDVWSSDREEEEFEAG